MPEIYTLALVDNRRPAFLPREDAPLLRALNAGELPDGYAPVARLGDPDLLHCVVCRRADGPGGCFLLEDGSGPLMAVVAESNLAYTLGLGRFGRLVSDARYAADIFENGGDDDEL